MGLLGKQESRIESDSLFVGYDEAINDVTGACLK